MKKLDVLIVAVGILGALLFASVPAYIVWAVYNSPTASYDDRVAVTAFALFTYAVALTFVAVSAVTYLND